MRPSGDKLNLERNGDTGIATRYQGPHYVAPHPFSRGGTEYYVAFLTLKDWGDVQVLLNANLIVEQIVHHDSGKIPGSGAPFLDFNAERPKERDIITRTMALLNSPVNA